jgi:hypothetical protein
MIDKISLTLSEFDDDLLSCTTLIASRRNTAHDSPLSNDAFLPLIFINNAWHVGEGAAPINSMPRTLNRPGQSLTTTTTIPRPTCHRAAGQPVAYVTHDETHRTQKQLSLSEQSHDDIAVPLTHTPTLPRGEEAV